MKNRSNKKIIVTSALIAGAAVGGAAIVPTQIVGATSTDSTEEQTNELHKRPELSEEKKAEIKAKLDAMTEEEKKEWLKNHRPKGSSSTKRSKPAISSNRKERTTQTSEAISTE